MRVVRLLEDPKVLLRQRGSTKSTIVSRLALTPLPAKYDYGRVSVLGVYSGNRPNASSCTDAVIFSSSILSQSSIYIGKILSAPG